MLLSIPRPRRNLYAILLLWFAFYASFTLFTPPLLDDADSVHAEVAREILLRHDWVTLYADGIRYLEKAPLLYWAMAASLTAGRYLPDPTPAVRLPLAFTVLALALAAETFGRRAFASARAGLYAATILLSSFGIFIFSRITIPDVAVCLWLTLAMLTFWLTEQEWQFQPAPRWLCCAFAACCALNVLTKGLIGIVFPVGIVMLHLLATRGWRGTRERLVQLHPLTGTAVFLAIAAPWHILAGLANPAEGHPLSITFAHGHWQVPLPTDGNVHGWFWFYFMNEHLLRYLNLRVPRDYDTVPMYLFYGLVLVWLMPWSVFLGKAVAAAAPVWNKAWRQAAHAYSLSAGQQTRLLLSLWAVVVLLFFSLSTRQEYYVLPALPALALLLAAWLDDEAYEAESFAIPNALVRSGQRISVILLIAGCVASLAAGFFLFTSQTPAPNQELASLLQQNPGDYALSFGHFLDLNGPAMGAFRRPLALTAFALFLGTFTAWWARHHYRPHLSNIVLASATFAFLIAAHLGLQIFSPVLSSYSLAQQIAPGLKADDLIVIHGEYEAASTLGFYLKRNDLHLLEGRSSNLWYGSFFVDAPARFEDATSLQLKWLEPRRIFVWQDTSADAKPMPRMPSHIFFIASSGGKEILSNQPNLYTPKHPSPY